MANTTSLCIGTHCSDVQTIDTSEFATKTELNAKQNTLTEGTGIDIANNTISVNPSEIFQTVGKGVTSETIPAGGRKSIVISNVAPTGYTIAAYRQVSILKGTDATNEGWKECFLQFFSTTGGGVSAQVAVVNSGTVDASVNISVTCLCIKS